MAPSPNDPPPWALLRCAWSIPALASSLIWLLALGVRISVRDAWASTQLFFHVTPPVVLMFGALVIAWLWVIAGSRWGTRIALAGAVAAAVFWFRADWRWNAVPADRADFRVAEWNAAYRLRSAQGAAVLNQIDADVIGVVETARGPAALPRNIAQFMKRRFNGLNWRAGMGMMLASRYPLSDVKQANFSWYAAVLSARAELPGGAVRVAVVDFHASPHTSRYVPMTALRKWIAKHVREEHVILLGDFNTPTDSAHFAWMRGSYRQAFDVAGRGYMPTWPMPAPVMCLDQIWVGRPLTVLRARKGASRLSDHAWVSADIAF